MRNVILLGALAGIAGCSDPVSIADDRTVVEQHDGGAGDLDAALSGLDAASQPDAASLADATPSDAAAPDASSPRDAAPNVGFVTVISDTSPARTRASATFLRGGPAYVCAEMTFGACTVYDCRPRPGSGARPAPHAGRIAITGPSSIELAPDANGTYPASVLRSSFWMGGETLVALAPGDQVPAFRAEVMAPRPITVLTPVPAGGADWTIDRRGDVALTWSGGAEEVVKVLIGSALSADPLELECAFRAGDARGTIPAAGLSMLPAGDGYYSAATRFTDVVDSGEWRITFRAESNAVLGDGRVAIGAAILR